MGHLERFRSERVSGGYQTGQGTSAEAYSGDGLAPIPAVRGTQTIRQEALVAIMAFADVAPAESILDCAIDQLFDQPTVVRIQDSAGRALGSYGCQRAPIP